MSIIRKLRRSLRRDGLAKTVALCLRNLRTNPNQPLHSQFDDEHGVQTGGVVQLGDLVIESPSDAWGIAYTPTPTAVFASIMGILPPPQGYSFVDLGCGKGRVILMASEHPFREVIGVEFSSELCTIAEANIATFRPRMRAQQVRILREDAARFDFPSGPLIVYFYFAFTRQVLAPVVDRLMRRVDETFFVYYNVHDEDLFKNWDIVHADAQKGWCIWHRAGRFRQSEG